MGQLIIVLHILACISLVVLVMMQQGKGADAGAAFGSGASNTVFGSTGSSSFLFKLTAGIATIFFVTSLILSNFSTKQVPAIPSVALPVSLPTQSVDPSSAPANKESSSTGFVLPVDTSTQETKKQNNE